MIPFQPLTSESFAPYGHVAGDRQGVTKSIRGGAVCLTKSPAVFRHDPEATEFALDFYDVEAASSALRITQAERHPHSAQMFVPMFVASYLVIVWEGHPDASAARGFIGGPEDLVIYHPGVWHHGIIALGTRGRFASTMWRVPGGSDVEFLTLETALHAQVGEGVS
ncbi:ureidoglycolate lyase [Pararhodobacter oceanensis]|uniref:Ureidoglycolate hydrolase n=1 Tax=Pararhodobacter oceanensis TaxID=2172121 RepID=A0A2T8HVB5_9RHOB|nr:ureidoglycolate lyase [Pararhodobacter oceanensis]PVH29389.1 hypothetical protein DDE20_04425 [Pararhodobacter oceanensis]